MPIRRPGYSYRPEIGVEYAELSGYPVMRKCRYGMAGRPVRRREQGVPRAGAGPSPVRRIRCRPR